jgi:hypothetical protein
MLYWSGIILFMLFWILLPLTLYQTSPAKKEPKLAKKSTYDPIAEMRAARALMESAAQADLDEWERQFARATGQPILLDDKIEYLTKEMQYSLYDLTEIDRMQRKSCSEDDFDEAWGRYVSKQKSRQEPRYDEKMHQWLDEEKAREALLKSAPQMILPDNDSMDGSPLRTDIDGSYVVISDNRVAGAWQKRRVMM